MEELNALLAKQYKRYRQRMDFLAWYLNWHIDSPFERMFRI